MLDFSSTFGNAVCFVAVLSNTAKTFSEEKTSIFTDGDEFQYLGVDFEKSTSSAEGADFQNPGVGFKVNFKGKG